MVKVLLTGITGFIGSHLARELVRRDFSVYGVVRQVVGRDLRPIKDLLDDVTLISADITDFITIFDVLRKVDPKFIIHLAAYSAVRFCYERPFDYMRVNLDGTMNIAESIKRLPNYENKRLIFASTAGVYGYHQITEKKIREDTPLCPTSPYAVSKAAADMYLRMLANLYGMNVVILRPSNTYGRKHKLGFMVEYLITKMLSDETVYVGAPESVQDYMYIDDHVNAYLLAMKTGKAGHAYNISTGKGITNRCLAIKIAEMIKYDQNKIIWGSYPPGYPFRPRSRKRKSAKRFIPLDTTKAYDDLGWKPKFKLEDGLKITINYFTSLH